MTDQIEALRAALEVKRAELLGRIRTLRSQLPVGLADKDGLDPTSRMHRRPVAGLVRAMNRTLADVDAALAAIQFGLYGICTECGEPIALSQLQVIPSASHCIGCQKVIEHRRQMAVDPYWDEAA